MKKNHVDLLVEISKRFDLIRPLSKKTALCDLLSKEYQEVIQLLFVLLTDNECRTEIDKISPTFIYELRDKITNNFNNC